LATDTLIILGDSYSDFYYGDKIKWSDDKKSYVSWPRMLDKTHPIKNISKKGVGPQWVVNQFQNFFNEKTGKRLRKHGDVKLLIFMPDMRRWNLSFIEDDYQAATADFVYSGNSKSIPSRQHEWLHKYVRYYVAHENNFALDELKYYTFFKAYSHFFKKICIIPTTPLQTNLSHLNDNKFEITKFNMDEIQKKDHPDPNAKLDYRINHLTEKNHHVMLHKVVAFIEEGTIPNINGFNFGKFSEDK